MMEQMKFGDIKSDIINNKKTTTENFVIEKRWKVYDSSLVDIGSSFSKVVPEEYVGTVNQQVYSKINKLGDGFKKYIEDTLSKSENGNRTAIEFGGSGSELFSGFKKKFFRQTAGVCLDDVRNYYRKIMDGTADHSVIVGDLTNTTNNELYNTIKEKLKTEKVDLIISRMMGPLNFIKKNPALLDKIIRQWYSLLNKNGLLFVQFEYFHEHDPVSIKKILSELEPEEYSKTEINVKEWVKLIEKRFPNEIEIKLGRGIIRIHKKENAPEELPPARELSI
jgi:hypothetical protein